MSGKPPGYFRRIVHQHTQWGQVTNLPPRNRTQCAGKLAYLYGGASLFQLALDGVCLFLVDAFLDPGGSGLNEFLGFPKAEVGDFADGLDDVDLVGAEIRPE